MDNYCRYFKSSNDIDKKKNFADEISIDTISMSSWIKKVVWKPYSSDSKMGKVIIFPKNVNKTYTFDRCFLDMFYWITNSKLNIPNNGVGSKLWILNILAKKNK